MAQLILNAVLLVSSFQAGFTLFSDRYSALPGYRLDLSIVNTIPVSNRIQCVRACRQSGLCNTFNTRVSGDWMECDLYVKSTNKQTALTEDGGSFMMYLNNYRKQDEPYKWVELCSTGVMTNWDNGTPVPKLACKWECDEYASCVFYQLTADYCHLCVANATEFSQIGLADVTTVKTAETYIKLGIERYLFPTSPCTGEMYPSYITPYFDFNQNRVTAIQFCATTFGDFAGLVAGFTLYINNVAQSRHGCSSPVSPDPFDLITFDDDEIVLGIDFYMGMSGYYNVVRGITVHTTLRVYGPLGVTSGSTLYTAYGYDFLGFSGRSGYGLDQIAANFARC